MTSFKLQDMGQTPFFKHEDTKVTVLKREDIGGGDRHPGSGGQEPSVSPRPREASEDVKWQMQNRDSKMTVPAIAETVGGDFNISEIIIVAERRRVAQQDEETEVEILIPIPPIHAETTEGSGSNITLLTEPIVKTEDLKEVVQKLETEENLDCKSVIETRNVTTEPRDSSVNEDCGQPIDMEERPAKRPRRVFLDAVEVPTVESVYGKPVKRFVHNASIEEMNAKIKSFKNPLVKKGEALAFSLDTVRERMQLIGIDPFPVPQDINPAMVEAHFSRWYLCDVYGGSPVDTFPTIRKELLDKLGLNDFMYPNLDMNPFGPQMPGSPGLFFETATPGAIEDLEDINRSRSYRVISRLEAGKWQYQGQYRMGLAPSLTPQEWSSQNWKVRNAWIKEILKKGWATETRARISLRARLGRAYTDEELAKEYSLERSYKDELTPDQVDQAFHRGEEAIAVRTMKCVGYDTQFQLGLVKQAETWVRPPPKKKGKGAKGQNKVTKTSRKPNQKSESKAVIGKKRKRPVEKEVEVEVGSDEDEEPSYDTPDEDSDWDMEIAAGPVYVPRGTRSRPIVVM